MSNGIPARDLNAGGSVYLLAGRDTDALVAEKVMRLPPSDWPWQCEVEEHESDEAVWCYDCQKPFTEGQRVPPPFSTSFGMASRVLEHMVDTGWIWELRGTSEGYSATFHGMIRSTHDGAALPALAICRAALRAVEEANHG